MGVSFHVANSKTSLVDASEEPLYRSVGGDKRGTGLMSR